MIKPLNANEILEKINNQWASTKDIKALACVGNNKAYEIKTKITKDLEENGYFLPKGLIPMEKLVEYLKINIKYLQKVASKSNEVSK